jgi:hypothetical protein
VIVLDADVLLIDIRYPNDARFPVNRQLLDRIQAGNVTAGITAQALLEVVGILSFNLPSGRIARLPLHLSLQYKLTVLPDLQRGQITLRAPQQSLSHRWASRCRWAMLFRLFKSPTTSRRPIALFLGTRHTSPGSW